MSHRKYTAADTNNVFQRNHNMDSSRKRNRQNSENPYFFLLTPYHFSRYLIAFCILVACIELGLVKMHVCTEAFTRCILYYPCYFQSRNASILKIPPNSLLLPGVFIYALPDLQAHCQDDMSCQEILHFQEPSPP